LKPPAVFQQLRAEIGFVKGRVAIKEVMHSQL